MQQTPFGVWVRFDLQNQQKSYCMIFWVICYYVGVLYVVQELWVILHIQFFRQMLFHPIVSAERFWAVN